MEISLFVAGLLLVVVGISLIVYAVKENEAFLDGLFVCILGFLATYFGIMVWIALYRISEGKELSTSKFDIKKEVRETVIDGKIISSDTIYLFTQKEK